MARFLVFPASKTPDWPPLSDTSSGAWCQDTGLTTEWKKIFTNSTFDSKLISKIHKGPKKLDIKQTDNPIFFLKKGTDPNKEFPLDKTQVVEKYFEKYSISSASIEMQMKTTLRLHLTTLRMTKINNTSDSSCCHVEQRRGAREPLLQCWWEDKLVQPLQ